MRFPEQYRKPCTGTIYQTNRGDAFGVFLIPAHEAKGRELHIIAVDGKETGWEHVSVTTDHKEKVPTWKQMCLVKDLFWEGDKCVVEFHPPNHKNINIHKGCLHLWRHSKGEFPMPPDVLV